MATHSSTLAWKIPCTEEPGRLQSMGSLRVRHDWAISLSLFTFMHWRRQWQPPPVLLPGDSQGWGSLVGCRLWGRIESDTTEATQQQQQQKINAFTKRQCNDSTKFGSESVFFMAPTQQEEKGVQCRLRHWILITKEELGCCYIMGVWRTLQNQNSLGYLLLPLYKFNGRLQQFNKGNSTMTTENSRMKFWFFSPNKNL